MEDSTEIRETKNGRILIELKLKTSVAEVALLSKIAILKRHLTSW